MNNNKTVITEELIESGRRKSTGIKCPHCNGTGSLPLTGVYAETLDLLRKHGESHGAALAKIAGCKACAMNNRLAALEKHGLVTSRRYGRLRLFKAKGRVL